MPMTMTPATFWNLSRNRLRFVRFRAYPAA